MSTQENADPPSPPPPPPHLPPPPPPSPRHSVYARRDEHHFVSLVPLPCLLRAADVHEGRERGARHQSGRLRCPFAFFPCTKNLFSILDFGKFDFVSDVPPLFLPFLLCFSLSVSVFSLFLSLPI